MAKYDGVNPFDKLHPDEPWFFIRAQDDLSTYAMEEYRHRLQRTAIEESELGNEDIAVRLLRQATEINQILNSFYDWQKANKDKVKLPD
jgi:hypothetical protein